MHTWVGGEGKGGSEGRGGRQERGEVERQGDGEWKGEKVMEKKVFRNGGEGGAN